MVLNEADTRIKLIDPVLERVGWKVKGSYVKEEVIHRDSKKIIGEAKKEVKELLEGFEELERIV